MKTIFIGSSSEALDQALLIARLLEGIPGVKVDLWQDVFSVGLLTFEAIERFSRRISGAVLLASPDDISVFRQQKVRVPRTNVMIELGYLTAILGRERVALCKYGDTYLASDLAGFTYVDMEAYPTPKGTSGLPTSATNKLLRWAAALPHTLADIPNAEVTHGYSGRWRFTSNLMSWCGSAIRKPDSVSDKGHIDLYIPRHGPGVGSLLADVYVSIKGCDAHFRVADEVSNVICYQDGSLEFTSQIHSRKRISIEGEQPLLNGFNDLIPGPNTIRWTLAPHATRNNCLSGHFKSERGGELDELDAQAETTLEKVPM